MHAVNAYLAVANVAASMDFLERVLGFTRGVVLDDQDGDDGGEGEDVVEGHSRSIYESSRAAPTMAG